MQIVNNKLVTSATGGGISPISYEKILTSLLSTTIPSEEHGLSKVRGVTLLTPTRGQIEVYTEIRADESVYIEALTNLNNHILILF